MDKSKNKLALKHVILPSIIFSIVFFLLYFRMQGISGGDLLVGAISSIFLVGMTVVIGLITFSWAFKEKKGFILGIVCSFILGFFYHTFLL